MTTDTAETEYTRAEAAERLGVSPRHLRRLIQSGHLDSTSYSNGAVRITESALERCAAGRRPRKTEVAA